MTKEPRYCFNIWRRFWVVNRNRQQITYINSLKLQHELSLLPRINPPRYAIFNLLKREGKKRKKKKKFFTTGWAKGRLTFFSKRGILVRPEHATCTLIVSCQAPPKSTAEARGDRSHAEPFLWVIRTAQHGMSSVEMLKNGWPYPFPRGQITCGTPLF